MLPSTILITQCPSSAGFADPGPIAAMFWLDDELGSDVYLDGVVTVVDAKYGLDQINQVKQDNMVNEAVKQVGQDSYIG